MAVAELGCSYALMILLDEGIPITAEKISALLKAANVKVESYWPGIFAKLAERKNIDDLIMGAVAGGCAAPAAAPSAGAASTPVAAAAAAVEEKKEELEEESEDDFNFSLFD